MLEEGGGLEPRTRETTQLVAEDLAFVRSVARRLNTKLGLRFDLDELTQMGAVGLLEAYNRYDEGSGVTFRGFAYARVRGAIFDGVRSAHGMSRSEVKAVRRARAAAQAAESMSEAGCDASDLDYVAEALRSASLAADLVDTVAADDEDAEAPSEYAMSPERLVSRSELQERIEQVLSTLSVEERCLVRAVYFEGRTLTDVGEELGISRSWSCRLHARTLALLRERLAEPAGRRP
jgi:RNA polymerase sigma factor for flagellar operon FliA